MTTAAILALVEALAEFLPVAMQLAAEVRAQLSTDDQATLDASLAKLTAGRQAAVAQAEGDLAQAAAS